MASSIASLLLAGMAYGATWSGTQLLTLGVDPGDEDVDLLASTVVTLDGAAGTLLENVIFNTNPGGITTLTVNNAAGATRVLAANATVLGLGNDMSLIVAGSADFRIGAVSDNGYANMELVKNGGAGELILDNLGNSLGGTTLRVVDGTMSIFGGGGTTSAVDTLINAIRIDGAAAKLRLGSLSGPGTIFNNNLAVNESGTLEHTASSDDTLGGLVALAAGKTLNANVTGGSLRLAGSFVRSGGSDLTKTGAGTLYLSGFGSGTGLTNVNAGILQYSMPGALYAGATGSWTAANISVASGATLAVNVGGASDFTTGNVTTLLTGLSTGVNNNGLRAGASFGFDTSNATSTLSYATALVNSTGTGGGAVGFTKLGTGTLSLSGTNTYTGVTTVSGGTLRFTKPGALYNSLALNWTPANIVVNAGTTLAVNVGGAGDFTTVNVSTLLAQISVVANNGLRAGATVGFDTTNATGTVSYASPITNSTGAGGGAVGFTKLGTGTLSLNGVSTYSGATTISAGTLALGAAGSITSSSGISIASGATYNVSAVPAYALAQSLSAPGTGTANVLGALNAGARTINLQDGANIGTLAFGSTLSLSGATLRFDLSATTSDRITVGGAVSLSGTNLIDVSRLASASALSVGPTAYTLITAGGGLVSSAFSLSSSLITIGSTNYTLTLSGNATNQYLGVASGSASLPTTYTLATSASAPSIRVGIGTSTITTTITNTGTLGANNDGLSYTSLGGTVAPGVGVTLGAPAAGATLAPNADGTAQAVVNQSFSSSVAGSYLVTASGGTVTNATAGGSPTLQGGAGTATINVYRLAAPNALGASLTFTGNHRVGDVVAPQTLSLTNTAAADGFSEKLDAIITGSGAVLGTGSVSLLAPGASSTDLQVGLNTSEVGALSGSVTVSLTSNGPGTSGLGTFALAPHLITVNAGSVYRLAAPRTIDGTLTFTGNHHVGDIVPGHALTLTNDAADDGFSERLDAVFTGSTGGATGTGTISLLAPEGVNTTSLIVGLNTSTVGAKSGTVTVGLTSNGTGTSLLGPAGLGSQVITVNAGSVFRLAAPGTIGNSVTLANVHVGDTFGSATLAITNTAANDGFSEGLNAATGNLLGDASAAGTITNLLGASTAISVSLGSTGTAGAKTGSVDVLLASSGANSGLASTALATQTVTVSGNVFRLAAPGTIGNSMTLANVHVGDTFGSATLAITNTAANDGFSEGLNAATGNLLGDASAAGTISNLIGNSTAISVSLGGTATAGAKSGSVDVLLTSSGANSGLANTALATQTVTVSGNVFRLAAPGTIGNSVTLPNVHVGDTFGGATLAITNTAANDGFSEGLNVATGNLTDGASAAGSFSNVIGNSTAISVGLGNASTATAGIRTGTVDIALTSNGSNSGLANTTLATQTVTVSGSVFRLAAPGTIGSVVTLPNVHVGGSFGSATLAITNTAAGDGFSEGLNASTGNLTDGASAAGSFSNVIGSSTAISVGLGNASTATAGIRTGTVHIALTSNGSNSGLANTALPTQTVTVTGSVFRLAAPATNLVSPPINLGRVHAGGTFGTVVLSVANTAPAGIFTEGLNAGFSATDGAATHNGGTITNLAGGATDGTSLVVGLGGSANTASAGAVSGTVTLALVSNGTNSGLHDTNLTPEIIAVTGFVYSGLGTWNLDGGGTWSTIANWQANGGVPGLDVGFTATDTATFGSSATSANVTVNLGGASPSLKALTFDNTTHSYTLGPTGGGILKLDNAAGTATVTNSNGSHTLGAPIELVSAAAVSVANSGDELTISGNITQSGTHTLTKTGSGTLNLTGTQSYGTLASNAGTTNVDGVIGSGGASVIANNLGTVLKFGSVSQTLSSLTIGAGATVVFSSGAASFSGSPVKGAGSTAGTVVPEPGTLGLLVVGALGMLGRRRRAGRVSTAP